MNKKSNLRKFLETASAFAMITGASSAAMGKNHTDTNANVVLTNAGGENIANTFNNGDTFSFVNHGKKLTTGGPVTIGSIDLNNKNAGDFTVAHATTVGPITDYTGNGQTIDVTVNDNKTLTLANNEGVAHGGGTIASGTFDGVGNIVLGSGDGGAVLTINSNATLGGST